MKLTRYQTATGSRWALDDHLLDKRTTLAALLAMRRDDLFASFDSVDVTESADAALPLQTPVEDGFEVWACGVTYLSSRVAREAESASADVYARVYDADRPEVFFKASGWRVVGHGQPVRTRRDSDWDVPEPELVLVVNRHGEIVGYSAGNDLSSRAIEGENPLYLPQAKTYDGSCAVGPSIVLLPDGQVGEQPIRLAIERGGERVYDEKADTSQMKRSFEELVEYATRELAFPHGLFLMTGTCLVPGDNFTLQAGDRISITVGELQLVNTVA